MRKVTAKYIFIGASLSAREEDFEGKTWDETGNIKGVNRCHCPRSSFHDFLLIKLHARLNLIGCDHGEWKLLLIKNYTVPVILL